MTDEPTTELALRPDQTAFDPKQVAALVQLGMKNAHPADLAVFFHQVQRTGLDPFARQIYMIERQGKQTIQTGIDGFRLVARRSTDARNGTFGYEPTEWCGRDGKWTDVWLADEPPAAARVTVIRDGGRFPAVALFTEYAALKRDGSLTQMWATKGALMLAKCSEALALRKAFPQDLSGLYTGDEMQAAGNQRPAQMPDHPGHGSRLAAALDAAEPELVTGEQLARLDALASDLGLTAQQKMDGVWAVIGRAVERVELLTKAEAAMCVESMERVLAARVAVVADELTGEIIDDPDTGSNFPPTTGADA